MQAGLYKVIRIFPKLIFLCLLIIALSAPAFAQRKNISDQEQGVLTFYRLSGIDPDFENWIDLNADYQSMKTIDPVIAEDYRYEELLRLQYAFGTIDLDNNYLDIQTDVLGSLVTQDNKNYLILRFSDKTSNEPYFPYNAANIWVAVIIKDISKFMNIPLSEEEMMRIQNYFPKNTEGSHLKLEITYRAISSQDKPVLIDGIEQFIMLGEIAQWTLRPANFNQSHNDILWEFIAPDYRTEGENDLINMLQGRE